MLRIRLSESSAGASTPLGSVGENRWQNIRRVILAVSQRVGCIPLVSVMWPVLYAEVKGGDSWAGSSVHPAQPHPRQLLPGPGGVDVGCGQQLARRGTRGHAREEPLSCEGSTDCVPMAMFSATREVPETTGEGLHMKGWAV